MYGLLTAILSPIMFLFGENNQVLKVASVSLISSAFIPFTLTPLSSSMTLLDDSYVSTSSLSILSNRPETPTVEVNNDDAQS